MWSILYILLNLLFRFIVGGLTAFHENTFEECFVHNYTLKPLCKSELLQHCEKSIGMKQKLSDVLCQGQCSRKTARLCFSLTQLAALLLTFHWSVGKVCAELGSEL